MQTETQPTEFKIQAYQLKNVYKHFLKAKETSFVMYKGDGNRGYQLAISVNFNSFKIAFRSELNTLGLDTETEI